MIPFHLYHETNVMYVQVSPSPRGWPVSPGRPQPCRTQSVAPARLGQLLFMFRANLEKIVYTCRFVEPLRTGLPFLDGRIALKPGHLLEVVGPSGSAKSELLLQVSPTKVRDTCRKGSTAWKRHCCR